MKSLHLSAQFRALNPSHTSSSSITLLRPCKFNSLSLASPPKPSRLSTLCASNSDKPSSESAAVGSIREGFLQFENDPSQSQWNVEVGSPNVPGPSVAKLSLGDQAFFLMAFIACTTSVAFTSLVIAAVPTICAMGRAATSLSKLADTARQELPSTMAAIRLSGMEISDLTLELNDLRFYWRNYFKRQFGTIYMLHVILLAFFIVGWYFMILFRFDHSQEIADGVNKSTQAVQAAEAGIRQIGSLARQQTMSMIQERANLPVISLQPAVIGAAKKTSHAVGQVTKKFMNIISQRDSEDEDDIGIDRVEI